MKTKTPKKKLKPEGSGFQIYSLGYNTGFDAGKQYMASALLTETMEIRIRVRDKDDKLEQINHVITFEQIKSAPKIVRVVADEIIAKIASVGIIKKLIESNA